MKIFEVLVPATYNKNEKPGFRYTWHWEKFKWWKMSHLKAVIIYGAHRITETEQDYVN